MFPPLRIRPIFVYLNLQLFYLHELLALTFQNLSFFILYKTDPSSTGYKAAEYLKNWDFLYSATAIFSEGIPPMSIQVDSKLKSGAQTCTQGI